MLQIYVRIHTFPNNFTPFGTPVYSWISIYRSHNVRFLVFIMRHLWSRIKFHINNVIYFRIHRSPDLSFFRLYRCKSRSRHSICHIDFLAWFVWEKKLKRAIYVGSVLRTSAMRGRLYVRTVYLYLFVLYYLRFPCDLQFRVIHICVFSMVMALRKKRVRTLHGRLKIIHEIEKNPGEKHVDIAKWLGLPASSLTL
jgi:hypothetical protein